MKWLARLDGQVDILKELSKLLINPDICIIKLDNSFYLSTTDFYSLSLDEVYNLSHKMVGNLNSVANLILGYSPNMQIDCITKINDDNTRNYFTQFTTEIKIRSGLHITTHNGDIITPTQLNKAELVYKISSKYKEVSDALRFFCKPDWVNLYKVFEIIRDDLGETQIIEKLHFNKKVIKRFTQSAQSMELLGDLARHASKKYYPPETPMYLEEAKSLIGDILKQWINFKLCK